MRLLFDQNLSPELPAALSNCYVESQHVRDVGMQASPDAEVWAYAARQDLALVTKDSDFRQRSFVYGFPPKVMDRARELLHQGGGKVVEGAAR